MVVGDGLTFTTFTADVRPAPQSARVLAQSRTLPLATLVALGDLGPVFWRVPERSNQLVLTQPKYA